MQVATPSLSLHHESVLSRCVTSIGHYEDLGNALDFASFWLTFVLPSPCQGLHICILILPNHFRTSDKCIRLKHAKGIGLPFGYRGMLLNQSWWCFVGKTVGLRY